MGAEEYNTSKEKDAAKLQGLRDAVGIKAKDDLTLVVTLKEPRASFLDLAALWPMYPIREDIVKANSAADKPDKWADDPKTLIGNGPFKMTEWVHQDHITLVPNENYFGAETEAPEDHLLHGHRHPGQLRCLSQRGARDCRPFPRLSSTRSWRIPTSRTRR